MLLKIVADLVEAGQDLNNFCRRLSGQFRNLMVLKAGIADPALLGIPESILPDLREQADLFSREDLLRLFDAFQKIETGMRYATQVRFQLEMGLIELAHVAKLRPMEDLIAEFSAATEGDLQRKSDITSYLPTAASSNPPTQSAPPRLNAKPTAAETGERSSVVRPVPTPSSTPPAEETAESLSLAADPRNLLFRIAAAVGRKALESLLLSLEGAQLKGNLVVLQPGSANEFVRRQIKDDFAVIAQAATRIVGSPVKVTLGEPGSPADTNTQAAQNNPADENDLLEMAKREPVVKSFLDVFPGPVKAEKIDK
jgi:DNA polymerase III gamma/tau subunit